MFFCLVQVTSTSTADSTLLSQLTAISSTSVAQLANSFHLKHDAHPNIRDSLSRAARLWSPVLSTKSSEFRNYGASQIGVLGLPNSSTRKSLTNPAQIRLPSLWSR